MKKFLDTILSAVLSSLIALLSLSQPALSTAGDVVSEEDVEDLYLHIY